MDAARFYAVGRGFVPSGDCGGDLAGTGRSFFRANSSAPAAVNLTEVPDS